MIKSISYSQDEIISDIIRLHNNSNDIECDVTYGNGSFYKKINEPKYKYDLDPQHEGVIKADSSNIPMNDNSLSSLMFDPPFLCDLKKDEIIKENQLWLKGFLDMINFQNSNPIILILLKKAQDF